MANAGTAISSDTLVDMAYQNIRKDIIEDYLPAGEKIKLTDLCQRYQVSPTPIKQALNRLIAEGFVDSIPRKGCRVHAFSWTEVDDLFELRLLIELHFAEKATAAVASSPQLQARFARNLEENLYLVKNFSTSDEYFRTYQMDQEFHELLVLSSGNQSAVRMYKTLNSHAYAAYLFGKQPRNETINGILEHEAIYQAMRAGDAEQVRTLVQMHIENARHKVRLFLKTRQTEQG